MARARSVARQLAASSAHPSIGHEIGEDDASYGERVSYSIPQQGAPNGVFTADVPSPALPWKIAGVAGPGVINLKVAPAGGAATCRIVIEKKEVAKKQGQPGAPLTCTAKVKGDEG